MNIKALSEIQKSKITRGQYACILMNKDFICIETLSGYGAGQQLDYNGVQHLLPFDANNHVLGEAVLDAMAHSRFVISRIPDDGFWVHPDATVDADLYNYRINEEKYKKRTTELIRRYGYRSKSALFKGMKYCDIARKKGTITINSWRRVRCDAWDGLNPPYEIAIPETCTPEEIGAALRLALEHSKG
jgi:hypothetical protein